MTDISYREATHADVHAMAKIRSAIWESTEYWTERIESYMAGNNNPQDALPGRQLFVATKDNVVIGFTAGHLSTRYGCQGELQWINVEPDYHRHGIATALVRMLAGWFVKQNAHHICTDVDPGNIIARAFYQHLGADNLSQHWMAWTDIGVMLK